MLAEIFSFTQYAFGAPSLMPIFSGFLVALVGVSFFVREGGARFALPFFVMSVSAAMWLISDGLAHAANSASIALGWYRIAHASLLAFPISFLMFTHGVAGPLPAARLTLRTLGIASGALAVAAITAESFIRSVSASGAGYLAQYGWLGHIFSAMFLLTMGLTLWIYVNHLTGLNRSYNDQRRARLLSLSSVVGILFTTSFLPANGLPIYVPGHWVLLCFFGLTAYVSGRYRMSDITPSLIGAQIASTMSDALLVVDRDATLRQINPAGQKLFGVTEDDVYGTPIRRLLGSDVLRSQINAMAENRKTNNLELDLVAGDGSGRTVSVSSSVVREFDGTARAFLFILRDISTRKEAEERVRELAYFDMLTKLPNRAGFNDELARRIEKSDASPLTLLFLDLDRFKRVNDTLGHGAGDKMLEVVARRLQHCLRHDSNARDSHASVISRLGGDEFVICLDGVADLPVISNICDRILNALSQPIDLDGQEVFSGASIGVSRFPTDGQDAQTLLKTADLALYAAKDAGRNNYQFYDQALEKRNRERVSLEADIRRALDQDEFSIHFQPLIDIRSGIIVGGEALLRWQHPERGYVQPAAFVPVAEEAGLIAILGERVMRRAIDAVNGWHSMGFNHMTVAVNVSEHQFRRHNLIDVVKHCVAKAGVPPSSLILELTEAAIMHDSRQTNDTMRALKEIGVRLSLDDFGTGYSSLSNLKLFPIDMIKVDGSFTRGMATNQNDASITRAIIAMASSLGIQVIAEGIEDDAQVKFLRHEQCHFMQGYLFGAPMPLDEFTQQLRGNRLDNANPPPTLTLPIQRSRDDSPTQTVTTITL